MSGQALIRLQAVTKIYRMGEIEVQALRQVSLDIEENSFVAIMGSSGSGKSTLMNLIGCLDRPTSGQYFLLDKEISRLNRTQLAEVRNRTLGFVFQNFNLLSRTTALENVELPLLYAGVSTRQRRQRAEEALERVGLKDRMKHHPSQLSGGQQQRVAIARALVGQPRLILADEPTGNLDSHTRTEVMELFSLLHRSGMAIVMVTHEHDVAAYASRLLTLCDGQISSDHLQPQASASRKEAGL